MLRKLSCMTRLGWTFTWRYDHGMRWRPNSIKSHYLPPKVVCSCNVKNVIKCFFKFHHWFQDHQPEPPGEAEDRRGGSSSRYTDDIGAVPYTQEQNSTEGGGSKKITKSQERRRERRKQKRLQPEQGDPPDGAVDPLWSTVDSLSFSSLQSTEQQPRGTDRVDNKRKEDKGGPPRSPERKRSPGRQTSPVRRKSPERRKSPARRSSPGRQRSPGRRSPGRRSPGRRSPLRRSPLRRSPLRRSPLRRSPLRRSPLRRSPIRQGNPGRGRSPGRQRKRSRSRDRSSRDNKRSRSMERNRSRSVDRPRQSRWSPDERNLTRANNNKPNERVVGLGLNSYRVQHGNNLMVPQQPQRKQGYQQEQQRQTPSKIVGQTDDLTEQPMDIEDAGSMNSADVEYGSKSIQQQSKITKPRSGFLVDSIIDEMAKKAKQEKAQQDKAKETAREAVAKLNSILKGSQQHQQQNKLFHQRRLQQKFKSKFHQNKQVRNVSSFFYQFKEVKMLIMGWAVTSTIMCKFTNFYVQQLLVKP